MLNIDQIVDKRYKKLGLQDKEVFNKDEYQNFVQKYPTFDSIWNDYMKYLSLVNNNEYKNVSAQLDSMKDQIQNLQATITTPSSDTLNTSGSATNLIQQKINLENTISSVSTISGSSTTLDILNSQLDTIENNIQNTKNQIDSISQNITTLSESQHNNSIQIQTLYDSISQRLAKIGGKLN